MTELVLAIGKVFETREGNRIQINAKLDENTEVFQDGFRFVGGPCGQYYTAEGRTYLNDPDDNPGDLVKDITSESEAAILNGTLKINKNDPS